MSGCSERSSLACFSDREKDIRFNVYLVGALAAKLPQPFRALLVWMIRHVRPNRLFGWIRRVFYRYSIENTIFKLHARPAGVAAGNR